MTKGQSGAVAALWYLSFVNYLERVAMGFAGPTIMKELAMTPAQFGIVLSSFGVGYLLAQTPGGFLSDRLGTKTLLTVGPFLWAVFTGATGLVSTLAGFVVIRVCFGMSEGLSNTSIYKTLGDVFLPKDRSRVLGIVSTAVPLAPALAGAIVGKLVVTYGWQAMFFVMVVPALLAGVICYFLIPRKRATNAELYAPGFDAASFRSVLRRPSLWILSVGCFAWNIPYWGFLGWMPSYLALARHIDLKSVGALGGIPYVFAFFGLLVGGWLGSGAFEHRCAKLSVGFFVGGALFLLLAYEAANLPISLMGLSGAAFFLFGASAPIGKLALDLAPARCRATYVGFYNSFGQAGGIVAPAAIGAIVTATGSFAGGFGLMIAAFGVASILLLFLPNGTERRAAKL